MKKVLFSVAVIATLGMTSCGGADMCGCVTDMFDMAKKYKGMEDGKDKEVFGKELDAKANECKAIGKEIEKGKSDEEIKEMKLELMKSCDAVKNMNPKVH